MASYDLLKRHSPHMSRSPSKDDLLINGINSNDLELITKVIKQGADLNKTWPFAQYSTFAKAVEKGNLNIIKYLIGKNPDLHCNSANKTTPLIVSIRSNCSLEVVEVLVRNGANVNESDASGRTPLNEALSLNKNTIVELLLMNCANVNQPDGSGKLPIILAVLNNRLEMVKMLVSRGADVNQSDSNGNCALTIAQRLNDPGILNYFEEKTSVRNVRPVESLNERTMDSVEKNHKITTELTHKNTTRVINTIFSNQTVAPNQNLRQMDSTNEKKIESAENNTTTIECVDNTTTNATGAGLSDHCVQNNSNEEQSIKNILRDAIYEDSLEEIKSLLQPNNVNQIDDEGFTPLARAVQFQKIEVVQFLLTLNVNTCKSVNGQTPLQLAVKTQNLQLVELLLAHGAEHTIQTAFFEAVNLSNLEIINFLINKGVELNVEYKSGYTVLTKAVESEKIDIVKVLVESGANVNKPDKREKLPLVAALEIGNRDILSYLIDKGATFAKGEMLSCLERLIENYNFKKVKAMVELLKVDVNVLFDSGYSPLTKATELGNLQMVEYFLSQNSGIINEVDGNTKFALSIAAANEDLPMVKFFINSGADINVVKTEIEEYANISEDFALYMDIREGKYTKWKQNGS